MLITPVFKTELQDTLYAFIPFWLSLATSEGLIFDYEP